MRNIIKALIEEREQLASTREELEVTIAAYDTIIAHHTRVMSVIEKNSNSKRGRKNKKKSMVRENKHTQSPAFKAKMRRLMRARWKKAKAEGKTQLG